MLRFLWVFHLDGSRYIEATGSLVTRTSLIRTHPTFPPGAALAVSGFRQNSFRANDDVPLLTGHRWFTYVRISVSDLTRSSLAFSVTLTAACSLPPQASCEGPP